MNENVGSIGYDARIDTKNFSKDASTVEKRAEEVSHSMERSAKKGFGNFASQASSSFGTVADGLGRILKSAVVIGASGSVGIGAMTAASWEQVSAVQQATVALNAYEKDTGKVNKTLAELVSYARSDLGVLFNRKDLFSAAQGLKIMGDNTDSLTDHVKIMSRSVGLGLSTFEGLGNVINRVGSTGILYADDLKYLQNAGFKLDSTMSGTTQTFETLFAALDKGIPADAMAGQADTIVGMGVRLQTAFRGIGDAILGVDADSGKFIKGGLGDKLVKLMGTLRDLLKDPALKQGFANMGKQIGEFSEKALPVLINGFKWIVNNMDVVVSGIAALAAAFVAAKVAAIGFSIAANANPIGLIAIAVAALVAGLVYLQQKFDVFGKAMQFLKPVTDQVVAGLKTLYEFFQRYILPILVQVGQFVLGQLKTAWEEMKAGFNDIVIALSPFISKTQLIQGLLIALSIPLILVATLIVTLTAVVVTVVVVIARLIGIIAQLIGWYSRLSSAVTQAMAQFLAPVVNTIGQVIRIFGSLNGKILGALGNTGNLLFNAGKGIIDGFINGIKSSFGDVQKTLGDLTSKLPSWKGPESTDKKILNKSGQYVIGGFIDGLESMYSSVGSSLGSLTTSLGMPSIGSADSIDSAVGRGNTNRSTTVNVSLSGVMSRSKSDERDIAKSLIRTVNDELSAKGVALIGGGSL